MRFSARRPDLFTLVLCPLVAAWLSYPGAADDWPHWLGPKHDSVWRETGIVDSFPEGGPPVTWRVQIHGGYSGPAVAGGRVYVTDRLVGERPEGADRAAGIPGNERILCLDADSGEILWQFEYECPYKIAYPEGPRTTPVVDGDRVYALGAMGDLVCLSTSDGALVWQKKLTDAYQTKPPVWGYAGHPLVDGDKLICTVGGAGSGVVAFDKFTGEELWKAIDSEDIGYAPPMILQQNGSRQLIIWYDVAVAAFDPDSGEPLWTFPFPDEKPQRPVVSIMTPRASENRLFISNFYEGASMLEVGSDPPSAQQLWSSQKTDPRHEKDINTIMTTPFFRDGCLYGLAGNGELRCVDMETGDMKWSTYRPLAVEGQDLDAAPPAFRGGFPALFIIAHEDRFLLFTDQGELILANLTPDGYEEIDRTKLLDTTGDTRGRKYTWCHPAFAGGHMFVRNDQELICVDLRSPAGLR